ncbi:MAG TPA: amino acid adenylation domain-containing protein, partial [Rhodocyclaceae bacterium]|nr:amino acid adenylation domain-containing protein [Rhodocyclaceae bacterium]
RVGRNDNFFELGGDSILSLQIVAKVRRAGWKISPRQLFERQTIAELAAVAECVQQEARTDAPEVAGRLADYIDAATLATLPFDEADVGDVFPLAPTQEGMLFHSIEAPGSGLYVNQMSVEVFGLDAPRLAAAWQAMVERHPVLRTSFLWQQGLKRPVQIVHKQVEMPVVELDWHEADDLDERLRAYADTELRRDFDFAAAPLARLSLIRTGDDRHQLIWTQHHILLDGWSDTLLIGDWLRCYGGETLPAPGPGYGEYVRWLMRQDAQGSERFWKGALASIDGPTLLAQAVGQRNARSGYAQIYTRLDSAETRALQAFVQGERITLNTLIQGAWALLLQRHTGREQIVFGATVAGRPDSLADADRILGLFINTVPVPVARASALSVGDYLRSLQDANARLREHEHAALADIQRWCGTAGQALFDSIVVFENFPRDHALQDDYGLRFGPLAGKGLTGYAMDLQVIVADTLEIEYSYGLGDFSDAFVDQLRTEMEHLLCRMATAPQMPVGELEWLPENACAEMLSHSRDAIGLTPGSPHREPVHLTIARHAARRPDAIALLMGERELSYAELNARANRLAHRLIGAGIGPESRVGVALERSPETIVALLAVLKAGGAYVPLDPAYPADRLAFMMEDAGLALLLTQGSVQTRLPKKLPPALLLDAVDLSTESDEDPKVAVHPDTLAYVIYTSGSTGMPKGVAVTHGPIAMHCRATANIYGMRPQSCELLFMSFSFDGAHERWLTTLTVGAALAIRDDELWSAEQTYAALHRYGVTNAAFPPAYLGQVAEWATSREDTPSVELYVFGGEAMPRASYDAVRRNLKPQTLINGYGPTETVVTPLIWKADAGEGFECAYAPIGRPVGERTAYVLDPDLHPVPTGAVGELYIGGYGLARGYLGRAGLSAERFVADPFDDNGGRLYRTGDLVRRMADGNIEYIGRVDHQVKIRGFRIELGEVEARMRGLAEVGDVAVLAADGPSGKQLIAYVVPSDPSAEGLTEGIRQALAATLPDYMVPAHFVTLDALPRLASGKLDRHALPAATIESRESYVAPSTPEAQQIADIWREVLGVERVGQTDNFFALGGDSLLSLKAIARMRGLRPPEAAFKLRDLMQRPTIAALLGLDAPAPRTLLPMNGGGAKPPLFCIHAGMGTVFDYQPLAQRLEGWAAVFGLPCRMLSDAAHRDTSLAQMAADYCRILREAQPRGPYRLFGWSLGGALAALIAAQLEADGECVDFLGLVDPYVPGTEGGLLDWHVELADFMNVVAPGAHAAVGDIDCAAGEAELAELIAAVLSRSEGASAYAEMEPGMLARLFMVGCHLKVLSLEAAPLLSLSVQPCVWWARERPQAARSALAFQLAQALAEDRADAPTVITLDAGHFDIVQSVALIDAVTALVSAEEKTPG